MAKATGPTYKLAFKRRRKNLTNYRKRLALLKSNLPRLVVRKSNRSVSVQCIGFTPTHDEVLSHANSNELVRYGWKVSANLPSAYLTGYLCGKKAKASGIKSVVLDSGLHAPTVGSFLFAVVKGVKDAGVEIPVGEIEFNEDRISGKHIAEYAKNLAGSDKYQKQFSQYIKAGMKPEQLDVLFKEVKKKIESEQIVPNAKKEKKEKQAVKKKQ